MNIETISSNFWSNTSPTEKVKYILDQYLYDLLSIEKKGIKIEKKEFEKKIADTMNSIILLLEENEELWETISNIIRENDFFDFFVKSSSFAKHIFEKPYWYAWDMHLMKKICDKEILWDSNFERQADDFFLSVPTAESVRQRAKSLFETLKRLPNRSKVLNLACWPALEVEGFLTVSDKDIDFLLIDNDPLTLQYLKDKQFDKRVKIIQANAFKLNSKRLANLSNNQKVDLAYSSGLFDYIPHKFAPRITKALFDQVKSWWKLIIGNFLEQSEKNSQTKRQRFVMDEILDWKLIYRTPEEIEFFLSKLNPNEYTYHIWNEYFDTNPNTIMWSIGFIIIHKK